MTAQEKVRTDAEKGPAVGNGRDLSGRVALVTGGAGGIGEATVRMLQSRGANVAVLDLADPRRASDDGQALHAYRCDIRDRQAVDDAVSDLSRVMGSPDIVVHNAGWTCNKPFLEITPEEEARIIAVNFVGALNVCRAALPAMRERKAGRVVLIGSDAARVGTPKETVYAGAKAALLGFAKSLAVEVARDDITVNVVSPGTTDTPLLRQMLSADQIDRRVRANPMGRIGAPIDVAAAVGYFVSANAGFVSGQVLSVNGAMSRVG